MAAMSFGTEFTAHGLHYPGQQVNYPSDVTLSSPDGSSTVQFRSRCPWPKSIHVNDETLPNKEDPK